MTRNKKILRGSLLIVFLALVLNWALASLVVWHHYDALSNCLLQPDWPIAPGARKITFETREPNQSKGKSYGATILRDGSRLGLEIDIPGQDFSPIQLWKSEASLHLASLSNQRSFWARTKTSDFSEIEEAMENLAGHLPKLSFAKRFIASLVFHPFVSGLSWTKDGILLKISSSKGTLWVGRDPWPVEAKLEVGNAQLRISSCPMDSLPPLESGSADNEVPGEELAASVAEIIRVATLFIAPTETKAPEVRRSGAGWMVVQDGHMQMCLRGSAYEIGHQHGSLCPEEIRRISRRLVYGVGLLYSFRSGEWFPEAARKLVERQRPFIAPAYFEEMEGLADGAGLPLALVQMTNIFPEFFHCSGAALMGNATVNGELLHARVLDYMVGIGLQDYAAVMAISRPGVNRFVTVGYAGFIGSVTGMNEKQVAIGEMGGDGQGNWDGVPMSLLIRQSLEDCDTLSEVEALMRESPRTCEYYYLISDGKIPSALGVAATPDKFETFGPGVWHEKLAQPIDNAVLLSGPGRYEKLVERVREGYGKISRDALIEIIKRPVAMKSNLHNVIFQPQSLSLSVADATRNDPACKQPYRHYSWNDLFSVEPSR